MKKGFLLGVLLLGAGAVSAQGLYASFQAGYGMATSTDVLGTTTVVTVTGDQTETNIYGTLGAGTAFGLNLGYNFSEHFGAELGVNYFLGSSVSVTEVTVPTGEVSANAQSSQVRLTPMLVVTTGGDFAVYGKGGLVLPVSGATTLDVTNTTNPLIGTVEQSFETKGSISLGFQGAAGVNYKLSDNLSLFGELSAVNLRIKAATRSMTKNSVGGTDVLESMDTYDKETTYVDELGSSSNNSAYNLTTVDENSAMEDLATKTNFSALFINIGVTYSL
ncbi:MAG: outer membrane protein [Crocinitomicaceae bacterium]